MSSKKKKVTRSKKWDPPPAGSKKREEKPSHVFLLPSKRKFPYKKKVGGKWKISCTGLLAALRRAAQHNYPDVEKKARSLYNKHCKKKNNS